MKTLIPSKLLAASLHCAGKQDLRNYLNGVRLELRNTQCRAVATDGNILSVIRYNSAEGPHVSLTIPRETIELALKYKSKACELEQLDKKNWSLSGIRFEPLEDRFPDYRRVVPSSVTGEAAMFHPQLFARIALAGKALGAKSIPVIRHNGRGAALVQFQGEPDFVGVIMPFNPFTEKAPDTGLPDWVQDRCEAAEGSEFV